VSSAPTERKLAERLGHASTQMVLDTYGHVLAGMQEEATAKLGAILFGK
jgi:integrase